MTNLLDLLPKSAAPVERASVRVVDARERHLPYVHDIIGVRYEPTIREDILPWLLRHWGLEDAAAFMLDHQRLYEEGKRWQTLRGRREAYNVILAWLDLVGWYERGTERDVRWGLFQIGLAEEPPRTSVGNLIGLANLSKRASSVLGRVYGGYDIRAMRLDGQRLDDAMLDDWSGIFLPEHKPKLSFGRRHGSEIEFDSSLVGFDFGERVGVAWFEEGFVLDRSKLDQELLEPSVVRIQAASISDSIGLANKVHMPWPYTRWPYVKWSDLEPFAIYGGPDGPVG